MSVCVVFFLIILLGQWRTEASFQSGVKKCFVKYQISIEWRLTALHCRCLFTHKRKNHSGQSANSSAKPLAKDREARWGGGCWCVWVSAIQLLSKLQKKHFETRCKWTVELLKWTQATLHTTGILKVIFILLLFFLYYCKSWMVSYAETF